jgi:putative membrane protein insertion efficiency factor
MVGMWGASNARKKRKNRPYLCDCGGGDLPCCDFGLLSAAMLVLARADGASRSQRAVTSAIRGYRRVLSPRMPVRCRYEPSCSAYGLAAVARHGTRDGLRLTAARLRRCRPGVPYGTVDPVP